MSELGYINMIIENKYKEMMDNKIHEKNMNYLIEYPDVALDEQITPLTTAAFLGRKEILSLLLENPDTGKFFHYKYKSK